jgi:hypothetical protein
LSDHLTTDELLAAIRALMLADASTQRSGNDESIEYAEQPRRGRAARCRHEHRYALVPRQKTRWSRAARWSLAHSQQRTGGIYSTSKRQTKGPRLALELARACRAASS